MANATSSTEDLIQTEAASASAPNPASPPVAPAPFALWLKKPWLPLFVIVLLFIIQWLVQQQHINRLQEELARRLAQSDTHTTEARTLAHHNQEQLQAMAAKLGVVESRLAEAQTQQLALDSMYQELSSSHDERLLAEVEQAVTIAAQQLQIAGNVEPALLALQAADARLARAASPRLLPLRKLINRDIDRLKALPLADMQGISMRLEGLIAIADTLPLAFEQRARAEPLVQPLTPVATTTWWQDFGRELWHDIRQLVRIERVERADHSELALLSPSQIFFLRENFKLRLITARMALLQRDGKSYREDLNQTRLWLERYFDMREKSVISVNATLKSLATAELSLNLPTLNETLGSIRNLKLAGEKGK